MSTESNMSREEKKMARIIASIEKMEQRSSGTKRKMKANGEIVPSKPPPIEKKKPPVAMKEGLDVHKKKKKKLYLLKKQPKGQEQENKNMKSEDKAKARPRRRHQEIRMNRKPFKLSASGCLLPPKKLWLHQWKSDLANRDTEPLEIDAQLVSPEEESTEFIVKDILDQCVDSIVRRRPLLKHLDKLSCSDITTCSAERFTSPQPTPGLWQNTLDPEARTRQLDQNISLRMTLATASTSETLSLPKSLEAMPPFQRPWNRHPRVDEGSYT